MMAGLFAWKGAEVVTEYRPRVDENSEPFEQRPTLRSDPSEGINKGLVGDDGIEPPTSSV
jgi:hypothetical protein